MFPAYWLKSLQEAMCFREKLWFTQTLAIEKISKPHDNYK